MIGPGELDMGSEKYSPCTQIYPLEHVDGQRDTYTYQNRWMALCEQLIAELKLQDVNILKNYRKRWSYNQLHGVSPKKA